KNRESKSVPAAEVTELATAKVEKFEIAVEGSGLGLSVQQRVDTWHTFAYVDELPEGFTALPPP
ncbi:MAG TPA: hypothetical protein VI818_08305, partial [Candidatus Thermoplasmatota archaeon]|nr:hypothetical protein [Candidatus Thermoplasmatota archaeon]